MKQKVVAQSIHLKVHADVWPQIEKIKNRNGWINQAIREKLERDGVE